MTEADVVERVKRLERDNLSENLPNWPAKTGRIIADYRDVC